MKRFVFLSVLLVLLGVIVGCGGNEDAATVSRVSTPADEIWARVVPAAGTETVYGIPLSFANTQMFIDWYNTIGLTQAERMLRDDALAPFVAPCCDEYPMSTCCCECNLSRSIWGLCAYLISEYGYSIDQLRVAALQWSRFIRPDYYVAQALEEAGRNPAIYGVSTESSCFTDRCELPFYREVGPRYIGGCGGMEDLVAMKDE
jgi:hypothetical protein